MYRGLDAATAKPEPRDRRRVPHWMIDVADPAHDFSVADYVRGADAAIAAIAARRRVPIVAGGTGMYLRGLLKGLVPAPARDAALRERLRGMTARYGAPRVWRLLRRLDPVSAARVRASDSQRVVRALELAYTDGARWSDRLAQDGAWGRSAERYRALKFGLAMEPAPLAARLDERVGRFFSAGLVEEVRRLLGAGLPISANALKAIGYREVVAALRAGTDPADTRAAIALATRRYAKRQRTWFRSEDGVRWLDAAQDRSSLAATIAAAWKGFAPDGEPGKTC